MRRALCVLEFHFRQAVVAGHNARSLHDGRVQDGAFQSLSRRPVHLDLPVQVAEADDPDVRLCERAGRCGQHKRRYQ